MYCISTRRSLVQSLVDLSVLSLDVLVIVCVGEELAVERVEPHLHLYCV